MQPRRTRATAQAIAVSLIVVASAGGIAIGGAAMEPWLTHDEFRFEHLAVLLHHSWTPFDVVGLVVLAAFLVTPSWFGKDQS